MKLELSSNELQAIKNDKLYYFQDEKIMNNLKLFEDRPLYKLINEEKNKRMKFALSNKKIGDKSEKKDLNKNNYSYFNLKEQIKQRNNKIKYGILKIKQEEKKNNLIKEKRKNIGNILKKEAFKELNTFINDKNVNYSNFINSKNRKYIEEEYITYNKNRKNNLYVGSNYINNYSNLKRIKNFNKINLSSKNKLYKKFDLQTKPNLIDSNKNKNRKNINESKSLDTLETQNTNKINSSSITKGGLLSNKSSSFYQKYINKLKHMKIEANKYYDENNERKTIILMTKLIKDIYKKNKNNLSKNNEINKKL